MTFCNMCACVCRPSQTRSGSDRNMRPNGRTQNKKWRRGLFMSGKRLSEGEEFKCYGRTGILSKDIWTLMSLVSAICFYWDKDRVQEHGLQSKIIQNNVSINFMYDTTNSRIQFYQYSHMHKYILSLKQRRVRIQSMSQCMHQPPALRCAVPDWAPYCNRGHRRWSCQWADQTPQSNKSYTAQHVLHTRLCAQHANFKTLTCRLATAPSLSIL